MLNKTSKGNRRELEARKLLKEWGYLVEKKNSSRWESNDFFKLFDIWALDKTLGTTRLIQVKSAKTDFYGARLKIESWSKDNDVNSKTISLEVWLKENRTPWRMEKYKDGQWRETCC